MATIASHPQRNTLRMQLRENLLLREMQSPQWEALEPLLTVTEYRKGDRLAHQGDEEMLQFFVLEGMVKRVLPDAHTDFIFAVAAEEFGIIVCIALVLVFGLVVFRGLSGSSRQEDPFVRLAGSGLVVLFGVQSVINMSVNLNMIPAKGMTLPFISYGGSSMVAVAFGMGLLLAHTRRGAEPRRIVRRVIATPSAPAPALKAV